MGRPPTVQTAILVALAVEPALTYDQLTRAVFGEVYTVSNRANVARAVRALAVRGEVEIIRAWQAFPWLNTGEAVRLPASSLFFSGPQ